MFGLMGLQFDLIDQCFCFYANTMGSGGGDFTVVLWCSLKSGMVGHPRVLLWFKIVFASGIQDKATKAMNEGRVAWRRESVGSTGDLSRAEEKGGFSWGPVATPGKRPSSSVHYKWCIILIHP
jgi:hypothetical protein